MSGSGGAGAEMQAMLQERKAHANEWAIAQPRNYRKR